MGGVRNCVSICTDTGVCDGEILPDMGYEWYIPLIRHKIHSPQNLPLRTTYSLFGIDFNVLLLPNPANEIILVIWRVGI